MKNKIIISRLCKSFGDKQVLNDLSFTFELNSVTAVKGESGCGKTTLLRILAGLEAADSGNVNGIEGKKISFLFQEDRLLPWLTAKNNVAAVIKDKEKKPLASQILSELGLEDSLELYPAQLSGGMRRRVAIARALVYEADILLLDEAVRGLDAQNIENTVSVIKKYSANKTVISVTHSPTSLEENADFVLTL